MSKYHVNKAGEPGACKAEKGGCPFGGDDQHYSSKEAAQLAAEKRLSAEHGAVSAGQSKGSADNLSIVGVKVSHIIGSSPRTLNSYTDRLREEYAKVASAQPLDPKEVVKNLGFSFSDNVDLYIYDSPRDGLQLYVSVESSDGSDDGYDDTGEHPLATNGYATELAPNDYEPDYEYDGYFGVTRKTWRYQLPSDVVKQNDDYNQKSVLQPLYETLENKDLPDWASLPARSSRDDYLPKPGHIEARGRKIDELKDKLRKLQAPATSKRVTERASKIAQQQKVEKELADALASDLPASVKQAVKSKLDEVKSVREKAEKLQAKDQAATSTAGIDELKKKIADAEAEHKIKTDEWYKSSEGARVKKLAARYPSESSAERTKAARAWVKANPESAKLPWFYS